MISTLNQGAYYTRGDSTGVGLQTVYTAPTSAESETGEAWLDGDAVISSQTAHLPGGRELRWRPLPGGDRIHDGRDTLKGDLFLCGGCEEHLLSHGSFPMEIVQSGEEGEALVLRDKIKGDMRMTERISKNKITVSQVVWWERVFGETEIYRHNLWLPDSKHHLEGRKWTDADRKWGGEVLVTPEEAYFSDKTAS